MIRVGILGATGYTALELIKILLRHPEVEITAATSRQEGNPAIETVHPQLAGRIVLGLEDLSPPEVARRADCVFSCLPHAASAEAVSRLIPAGVRVVDLSADYRLQDTDAYARWYGHAHVDPDRLKSAVYGLPELLGDELRSAQLVANPGCYPTSAALPLAALLKQGLIETDDIIIDSKSGVSGAGRTPKLTTHFPECNESVAAYGVGEHRHTPEIEQVLSQASGTAVRVIFTPHLMPMDRGILTTAYARPSRAVSQSAALAAVKEFYAGKPFVRVVDWLPATKHSAYTNYCDITIRCVNERIVAISCLDNLVKGASGQAVQNFNRMYGFEETTALV